MTSGPGLVAVGTTDARSITSIVWPAFQRDHPDAPSEEVREVRRRWLAEHPVPPATVQQVADHIDHLAEMAGVEHVGIGSDFDGISDSPQGLEDISKMPALTTELLKKGYSEADIRKIMGENFLRVMREVIGK